MKKSEIEIVYQDDDILVVNKPSGISVTKDRSGKPQLLDFLRRCMNPQAADELRLVHRLDKDTSGVMILAKNTSAQSLFSSAFEKRLIKKTYLALVAGFVSKPNGSIDIPLKKSPDKFNIMCTTRKKGKTALTKWRLLADFGTIALLAVSPVTGRTHQIRVHLPAVGMPLAIDPLYGSDAPLLLSDFKPSYRLAKGRIEKPLIERLTLHAYQLELTDNQPQRPSCFIAPLDKKFAATIKMLTKHNPKGPNAFTNPDHFQAIINHRPLQT